MSKIEPISEYPLHNPAVAYVRVSTTDQEDKGTYENQEHAISDYAKYHDLTIVQWFEDLAISGNDTDRPGLNEMLNKLDNVKNVIRLLTQVVRVLIDKFLPKYGRNQLQLLFTIITIAYILKISMTVWTRV
ncbi:MAG TPA: recombinase family protein [Candidatus Lokiarchaeia archaeon]|nr:recombinase family protein [Candidatus Lokiarchaeia archaeon]